MTKVLAWDGALYAAPQVDTSVLRVSHDTSGAGEIVGSEEVMEVKNDAGNLGISMLDY